jgi:hypothetical protein
MNIARGGYREDLKQYFRSKWEANIARYYNFVGIKWIYEPQEFEFYKIKRGSRFYKPDFYLPASDSWVELKGFFRASDKTKLRRFKKYYPEEFTKLRFIIKDPYSRSKANAEALNFLIGELKIDFSQIEGYNYIEKAVGKLIPNWE